MAQHLITSALPYVNGVKHLGNLTGSMLPGDVYARFLRLEGHEVLFICATDEHGTPAELSAQEAGMSVEDYCRVMHERQREIYTRFGLSFDFFGRTSSQQNRELTQHFYERLDANGFIEERTITQVYSQDDGRFLPDRYVVGTCPKCGYEAARGDQCEQCTSVLDPTDLLAPRSAISGSTDLEVRETKHLFLRLDELTTKVASWIDNHPNWNKLTTSIARKWLEEGLRERGITRDLDWGVPVPRPGFEDKVFYVWFDAPIGYIGATREWADQDAVHRNWETWWLDAKDVVYTEFMAKDNVPFHTVFFPAMQLGTGEPWTKAHQIKSFNWLTYYGDKFSTSQKRGIFLDEAIELFDADCWRFYLLANSPEADDASFTWDLFATTVNKDLVGNFGNFVNRTLKLAMANFGNQVPVEGVPGEAEEVLQADCERVLAEYRNRFTQLEYRKVVQSLRQLWSLGNVYLDRRAPWALVKTDRAEAAMVIRTAIYLIKLFAVAALPIIPFAAEKVLRALNVTEDERKLWWEGKLSILTQQVSHGEFTALDPLFRRIDLSEITTLVEKYGG